MLTFEGSPILGAGPIVEKLTVRSSIIPFSTSIMSFVQSLPFQTVKHQITTQDAQPTTEGKILVSVTGFLKVRCYVLESGLGTLTHDLLRSTIVPTLSPSTKCSTSSQRAVSTMCTYLF